jgi:hypothetical protein
MQDFQGHLFLEAQSYSQTAFTPSISFPTTAWERARPRVQQPPTAPECQNVLRPFSIRELLRGDGRAPQRIGLDASSESDCIALMNTKFFAALATAAVLIATIGCVQTVTDRKTPAIPGLKDSFENRYERTVDQAFEAAKAVVSNSGVLNTESILHNQTNMVKTIEGKVNQRSVWVRIEAIDPKVTSVTVQTRTPGGAPDMDLAHQLATDIAVKLGSMR